MRSVTFACVAAVVLTAGSPLAAEAGDAPSAWVLCRGASTTPRAEKIAQCTKTIKDPKEPPEHKADAYLARGQYEALDAQLPRAVADFGKVIATRPEQPQAYVERCNAYQTMGKFEPAAADCTAAIARAPDDAATYLARGIAFHGNGESTKPSRITITISPPSRTTPSPSTTARSPTNRRAISKAPSATTTRRSA
jgi:tetratricopeptide (TPR) repeat protein